jgi:thioredoxin-like negative regulator of GroEL
MSQGGFDLPVLNDPSGTIAGTYGVTGVPTAVLIDAGGRIVSQQVGGMTAAELEAALTTIKG